MKRLYIAMAFIILACALCITEQSVISNVKNKMDSYINTAIEDIDNNDFEKYQKSSKRLDEYWSGVYPFLSTMIEHTSLDELSLTINSALKLEKEDSAQIKSNLYSAKEQINIIYNTQRVTFGNIF